MLYRFPQQRFVDLAAINCVGQLERAHLFAVQIYNIYVCHRLLLPPDFIRL